MKIQYASDLHLEFSQNRDYLKANPIKPVGDVLVLAGDIVLFSEMHKHDWFFQYCADNFQTTYWIPGNHEYYNSDLSQRSGTIHEKIKSNVLLVNNISLGTEHFNFIFSTLWTNISPANRWPVENGLSDFYVIKYGGKRFTTFEYNQFHKESITFLKQALTVSRPVKTVVVTHHVPTLMNYPPKYKGSEINEAFAVELFDDITVFSPDFWIYGHSHVNVPDFRIGETQLLTNQLGYVKHNEQDFFVKNKSFEI
jgi:predicted phosphohydrolase